MLTALKPNIDEVELRQAKVSLRRFLFWEYFEVESLSLAKEYAITLTVAGLMVQKS